MEDKKWCSEEENDNEETKKSSNTKVDKTYRKTKGWTRSNVRVVRYYVSFLSYMSLVYHFLLF